MPTATLAASMTERDFRRWLRYREQRLFPTDRIVLQLAQIAYWLARTAGVEDASIVDFVLEREPERED